MVVDDVALPTIMSGSNTGASVVKTTVIAGSSAVTSTTTSPSGELFTFSDVKLNSVTDAIPPDLLVT